MTSQHLNSKYKVIFILILISIFLTIYYLYSVIFKNAVIFYTTTLVIINVGFSTFLSLRSDYLYNSRNADMQMLNFLRAGDINMAKDWLHFSVIFRLEARSRGYSGLLCIYSDIALVIGLLLYLFTGIQDWYFYASSVYLFLLSFIFLMFDIRNKIRSLDGPIFFKRKVLKLPPRYDWIQTEIDKNYELVEYHRVLTNDEGDDS